MTDTAKDLVRQKSTDAGPPNGEEPSSPSEMQPSDNEDDYSFVSGFKTLHHD